jgi:hypothetical protein
MFTVKDKLYNGIVPKNESLQKSDFGMRVHCSNPESMIKELQKRLIEKHKQSKK